MAKRPAIKGIPTTIKNENLVKKRRDQIFKAVLKLFSRKGFHATTLREISKESGITLGNLYDYITTKEDTLYFIQEKAIRAVTDLLPRAEDAKTTPMERLERLIASEVEISNRYQDLILITYQESHAMSKGHLYSLLENERKHIERFEKIIEQGIKEGYFAPTNVRMLANMIKTLIDTWVIKRWDLEGSVTLEEMKGGILDLVRNGITRRDGSDGNFPPKSR
jgi:AcrR family transcriptional regulator